MGNRITEFASSISLGEMILGIFIGLVITSALSPWMSGFFSQLYASQGMAGYNPPNIQTTAERYPIDYDEGQEVRRLNNLTWKDEYEYYEFTVENIGPTNIHDFETDIYLPGCVVLSQERYTGFSGRFATERAVNTGLGRISDFNGTDYYCSAEIEIDRLPTGETASVVFITTRQFSRCDLLHGFRNQSKFVAEYSWSGNGQEFQEESEYEMKYASDQYKKVDQVVSNSAQLSVSGESYVYFYGFPSKRDQKAMSDCS